MTDAATEALKPCPFCGGKAKRFTLTDEANFGGDVIQCMGKCGCSSHVEFDRKENLVGLWNERASPAPISQIYSASLMTCTEAARELLSSDLASHGFQSCSERILYDEMSDLLEIEQAALRAIAAALSTPTPAGELREVDGWQPIATAPKDGTEVMVWAVDEEAYDDAEDEADFQQRPYPARCNFQGIWWLSGGCMKVLRLATHWRPLLTGPRALAQPGSGEGV